MGRGVAHPKPSRTCCCRLWTKLGQYLASRSDVVPQPIVSRLSAMLDCNEPRAIASIVRTIVDELGDERAAMIATIDPTPLSTASIAQARPPARRGRPIAAGGWAQRRGSSLGGGLARRGGGGSGMGVGWRERVKPPASSL